jgi:hypothetical protein
MSEGASRQEGSERGRRAGSKRAMRKGERAGGETDLQSMRRSSGAGASVCLPSAAAIPITACAVIFGEELPEGVAPR